MNTLRFTAATVAGLLMMPVVAVAQTEEALREAFSGEWFIFDERFGEDGGTCSIRLKAAGSDPSMTAETQDCAQPISKAEGWNIRDGQIFVLGSEGAILTMGGNQYRLTGEIASVGESVIVERAQGNSHSRRLAEALRKHTCYYRGTSDICAEAGSVGLPIIDANLGYAVIETISNLNVRAQPRHDAGIIGTVPKETEIQVDQCLTASDGIWCRAVFGRDNGWLAMTALRLNEWPVVTFESSTVD